MKIEDKWKIFAIGQCFSSDLAPQEAIALFDALADCQSSAEVEALLNKDEDVMQWAPYENMPPREFTEHVEGLALHAQQVASCR